MVIADAVAMVAMVVMERWVLVLGIDAIETTAIRMRTRTAIVAIVAMTLLRRFIVLEHRW